MISRVLLPKGDGVLKILRFFVLAGEDVAEHVDEGIHSQGQPGHEHNGAGQAAAAAADKQGKGESQVGHGDDAVDDDAGRDGLGSLIHRGYPHFSLF